ncbi:unnamed protein product (macronuclear) [Paramecium tetraurelia]|uniref:Uncharacterized protein n=1 Tax=Paramecium tetraurelia TaxID=5888 RepID=A0E6A6_PARTE|nr:uncharacterized protein GSPATT00003688001 [Paramecium tetraurelia]CAK90823.1 unnamed protein product [Paramecium tetraurelia]|eukprot:XP_001458220.1 hypothetical protein (macronuclear) [Paramecium tetraurelia strain d4-2]
MIKQIILILLVVFVIQARHQHLRHTKHQLGHNLTMKPGESCLPNTDLSGQKKEETSANQARKHLTKFADHLTEENRKAEDKQPFPNIYTYQDQNCIGNGQDPSKRDRRMRRS